MMVWEEDVKVALSDFRSLNPGRLPILTPYGTMVGVRKGEGPK